MYRMTGLARYIVANTKDEELKKHKLSFYIGSILPDCKPSFVYKRHEISGKEIVINFTPHLVPMNRGILATEYATLNKKADGTYPTYEEIKAVYDKYYAKERFVRVLKKGVCPETKWVEGSNYVDVNFVIDERTGRIVMMGALDNLVKGAAGQAVQNMNLLFGLDEAEGLKMVPMFP